MAKINDLVGLSIYPVAYLVSIGINLINGQQNVFDFPGSILFWLLFAFFNFFGLGFLGGFIFFILIWVNFILYKKISLVPFKKGRFFILLIVYLFLVFINAYSDMDIDIDM